MVKTHKEQDVAMLNIEDGHHRSTSRGKLSLISHRDEHERSKSRDPKRKHYTEMTEC